MEVGVQIGFSEVRPLFKSTLVGLEELKSGNVKFRERVETLEEGVGSIKG